MPSRIRLFYSTLCLVLLVLAALPIVRELSRPRDIWWTPAAMAVPLAEGVDRVEVLVRGQPLAGLLAAGQIQMVAAGQPTSLTASEVGLRLNNWDRTRAERLPGLLASAAASGAMALLFFLFVTGRLVYRGERKEPGAP